MRLPTDIIKNTEAFLALVAAVMAVAGLLLTILVYVAIFFTLKSLDNSISPEFDSAFAAIGSARETISSVSVLSGSAASGIANVSFAVNAYSDSTKNISESLYSISSVPPFSLDGRLASAAKGLRTATTHFSDASGSLDTAASAASNMSTSLSAAREDLGALAGSLDIARREFRNSMFMLNTVALAVTVVLLLLFSSVLLISISTLLAHYPRLFESDPGQPPQWGGGEQGQPHPPARYESYEQYLRNQQAPPQQQPGGYRQWQPGQPPQHGGAHGTDSSHSQQGGAAARHSPSLQRRWQGENDRY